MTVFDYLAEARNQPAWRSSVRRCVQTQLTAPGRGAAYELTRPAGMPWRTITAELAIVTYEPPRRLRWTRREGAATADIECELEALPDGTLVWYRETLDRAAQATFGLLDAPLRRYQLPRDLWRLKSIVEQPRQAADGGPDRERRRRRAEPGSQTSA
jgi:hypothetical protein